MEKKGCPSTWRTLEIMQQCRYGFTEDKVGEFVTDWSPLEKYAYILHDKDIVLEGPNKGDPVEPHIHLMLKFKYPYQTDEILSRAKNIFGEYTDPDGTCFEVIRPQNLQKCQKWNSAIAYLVHANAPAKYQYEDSAVVSNYDWTEDKEPGDPRWDSLLALIASDELRPFNYSKYMTDKEYHKYKKKMESAFEYYGSVKLLNPNRHMRVMYVQGESGTGKTTFAKKWCVDHNLSYAVSSSSNDPLQDYNGQDALILDDFRPRCWHMDDLLKLLDNDTLSSGKSRYHNKQMFYCRLIILTSVVPLSDIWSNLADEDEKFKEPVNQLLRRIGMKVIVRKNTILFSNASIYSYIPNPVLSLPKSGDADSLLSFPEGYDVQDAVNASLT